MTLNNAAMPCIKQYNQHVTNYEKYQTIQHISCCDNPVGSTWQAKLAFILIIR